jgi:UDP-glucose 4-epimerase
MTLLVTGASGFLGRHVVEDLSTESHPVIAVNGPSRKPLNIPSVSLYEWDELSQITEQPSAVISCHATVCSGAVVQKSIDLYEGNVRSTECVLAQFPQSRHIYCSTVSVYEKGSGVVEEDSLLAPISEYALSKLWGERVIARVENHAVVRFSSLYGKGMQEHTLIPNYVRHALETGEIPVLGKGARRQNYLHVQDAIKLLLQVAKSDISGIFLGTGICEYSNLEIAEMIAAETGAKIVFTKEDHSISLCYDNTQTRSLLNWHPEIEIETGVREYIQWKREQS